MSSEPGIIVVGVDGSSTADAALAFAVDEATRTGDTVEVVTAFTEPLPSAAALGMQRPGLPSLAQLRTLADTQQAAAVERATAGRATVTIAREVVEGDTGPVLVESARRARMLVVGSRSLGPVRAALLGSVSRYCARHAACPVVVVPEHQDAVTRDDADAVLPMTR